MGGDEHTIVAFGLAVGVVMGIRLMNSPRTAVAGNLLGASAVLGAIILTLGTHGVMTHGVILGSLAVGAVIGYVLAVRVAMIQMPQLVALLNGLGGAASALVPLSLLYEQTLVPSLVARLSSALAISVGGFTFAGSSIAAAKLDRRIPQRPVVITNYGIWAFTACLAMAIFTVVILGSSSWLALGAALLLLINVSGFGVVFALRIGGADMPVGICLLNALSGLAAAIAGFAVGDLLLVAAGAIVGTSGLILTRIMCRAMNRDLVAILTGRGVAAIGGVPADEVAQAASVAPVQTAEASVGRPSLDSVLHDAKDVIIVPGYGMALAQAQHEVKQLADALEARGNTVRFAIHPVAGRMPGHMHVLLAEADVPYEKFLDMDAINDSFKDADLSIIVGANDVVNPAASTAEGTPIYGMPVLRAGEAGHVIVCNLDAQPGYCGVANPLYQQKNVTLCFGDAKEQLSDLIRRLSDAS